LAPGAKFRRSNTLKTTNHAGVVDLGLGKQISETDFKNLDKLYTIVNYIVNNFSRISVNCRYDANKPVDG
jgi:hypothetical protein